MELERDQIIFISLNEIVPPGHFLRKLSELFPWEQWAEPFKKVFKGEKEYGPKGYPVAVLLKMCVLSFLYDMSDKQTEDFVRESNPARYFAGLSLNQPVPDETTLVRFRGRIVEQGKGSILKELFERVIKRAGKLGIEIGKVQVLDSVHTNSKINIDKEDKENRRLENKDEERKPPKDPDATWGCKGKEKRKDPETGEIKEHKIWFYGYKSHVSLNQKSSLVTSLLVSTGKDADSPASRFLLQDDMSKGIKPTVVTGDKAYDDIDLYTFCGKEGIFPAISLRKTRLHQKSEKIKKKWEEHIKAAFYRKALGIRYKIEQKFGEGKLHHSLGKCRYVGIKKFLFQSVLTFLSMNLKRIVKLVKFPLRSQLQLCSS